MAPKIPELSTVRGFVQQLSELKTIQDILWETTDFIGSLGFEDCVIYTYDHQRSLLQQAAAYGDKSPKLRRIFNPIEIPLGHGITGLVAMRRENMLISDTSKTPQYITDLNTLGSEVTVCIETTGQLFGVLDCESSKANAFEQAHLELLEFIVDLIAPKLAMVLTETELSRSKTSLIEEANQIRKELNDLLLEEDSLTAAHSMDKISRLTGGIAQDFNTQLGVIKNELELLCIKHPEVQGELTVLQSAIDRSAELIQRLLAYSSQLKLSPNSLNLAELVQKISTEFLPPLHPNIKVQTKIDPSLKNVSLDPTQMDHVLRNLTRNACEAMPDGGTLTLSCYNTHIEPEFLPRGISLAKGPYAVVEVSDTGVGMDDAVKKRIFEPYFTTKPTSPGTGLGLSMVYGFVKQSGGDLLVTSIPNKGSSIKLFFPSHDMPADNIETFPAPDMKTQNRNATILVLDDDANMAQSIAKLLALKGYNPLIATTANEAIGLAQGDPNIDLIISDVMLDADNYGPNVVRKIRAEYVPNIECIYISGFVNPGNRKPDSELNNSVFFVKPFSLAKLAEAVNTILATRADETAEM